ncbi:hypothetical protein [Rugosimonospora acidiphila]|uniref:hypothetical protein n=1 Tax=Rugosimonospora acidiphila TaxID=556531 RepID=UPI0031E87E93
MALYGCLAVLPALGAGACSKPDTPPLQRFPDCQTIVRAIPSNVLVQPQARFPGIDDAEAQGSDARQNSSMCPVLGLARDGRTQLQVQIWLDSAHLLATGDGHNQADVLGETAKSEITGFCMENPATSGSPITRSSCYTTTLDGSIAGAAVVHKSAVVAVRIDAKPNGQAKDEFQRLLQDDATSLADAVADAI